MYLEAGQQQRTNGIKIPLAELVLALLLIARRTLAAVHGTLEEYNLPTAWHFIRFLLSIGSE